MGTSPPPLADLLADPALLQATLDALNTSNGFFLTNISYYRNQSAEVCSQLQRLSAYDRLGILNYGRTALADTCSYAPPVVTNFSLFEWLKNDWLDLQTGVNWWHGCPPGNPAPGSTDPFVLSQFRPLTDDWDSYVSYICGMNDAQLTVAVDEILNLFYPVSVLVFEYYMGLPDVHCFPKVANDCQLGASISECWEWAAPRQSQYGCGGLRMRLACDQGITLTTTQPPNDRRPALVLVD